MGWAGTGERSGFLCQGQLVTWQAGLTRHSHPGWDLRSRRNFWSLALPYTLWCGRPWTKAAPAALFTLHRTLDGHHTL